MKRILIALCVAGSAMTISACAGGYGYGTDVYAGGPYGFDGFYDDFYGPIYDGYWGNDDRFYYRRGANEHRFHRGSPEHFRHGGVPGGHFHPMHGSMSPGRGMHMPHFDGGAPHGHHHR